MAHALKVSHMLYSGCQCQHRVETEPLGLALSGSAYPMTTEIQLSSAACRFCCETVAASRQIRFGLPSTLLVLWWRVERES